MRVSTRTTRFALLLGLLATLVIAIPAVAMAIEAPVLLGTTSSFAVLAGSGITVAGPVNSTTIWGDIGTFPTTSMTGLGNLVLHGTNQDGNTLTQGAKNDLITAYNDAAGRTGGTAIAGNELADRTLTAGVYTAGPGVLYLSSGTLTLDAQHNPDAVFIFQATSGLTIASGTNIELINDARFCRVFWVVPSDATLQTGSHFVGHLFAMNSIFVLTGATIDGQLLARNGAVTLDNNTITNGICASESPASLHVIKHVVNDSGRTSVAGSFSVHIKTTGGADVPLSPAAGVEAPGITYTLDPGTYVVSEGTHTGYTVSYSGDSDSGGRITLAAGEDATVTITNNDTAPGSSSGTVTGGKIPKTSTPLYDVLLLGVVLILVGAVGLGITRRRA
ncbi:MAG TPA: ice-binding family protein [Coriobacteriia bacterium]